MLKFTAIPIWRITCAESPSGDATGVNKSSTAQRRERITFVANIDLKVWMSR